MNKLNLFYFEKWLLAATAAVVLMDLAGVSAKAVTVGFEAESGNLTPATNLAVGNDVAAHGGQFIDYINGIQGGNSPSTADGVVDYSVSLPNGTYNLFARINISTFTSPSGKTTPSHDSMFVGNGFGVKTPGSSEPADAQWITVNNLGNFPPGTFEDVDGVDLNSTFGSFVWVNLTEQVNSPQANLNVPTYTSSGGGSETFQIGGREIGFLVDAFAFVTVGEAPNSSQLDAAVVPEPTTGLLLSIGSGLAVCLRVRSFR